MAPLGAPPKRPGQRADLRSVQAPLKERYRQKGAPVGFKDIRLEVALRSSASAEQLQKLLELTERYCVVLHPLKGAVPFHASYRRASP